MNVLILDASFPSNAGDSAIVACMVAEFRDHFPTAEIIVTTVGDQPELLAAQHSVRVEDGLFLFPVLGSWGRRLIWFARNTPQIAVALGVRLPKRVLSPRLQKSLALYRSANVVVSCGGGFLSDNYALQLPLSALSLRLAQVLGTPTVIFAQSVGPFWRRRSRSIVRRLVARTDLVTLRDNRSVAELSRSGVPQGVPAVTADVGLLLPGDREAGTRWVRDHVAPGDGPLVGVSVLAWSYPGSPDPQGDYEGYVAAMAEVCDRMVEFLRCRVVFISTKSSGETGRGDDRETAAAVRSRMRHAAKTSAFVDDVPHPVFVKGIIGHFDAMVSTRMHASIFATTALVPTVNIEYEFKSREYFTSIGCGDLVVDIIGLDAERLWRVVERMLGSLAEIGQRLERAVPTRISAARQSAMMVHKLLDLTAMETCQACADACDAFNNSIPAKGTGAR